MKLSLLESQVLAEARDPKKKYTEKKVKNEIQKVIVNLDSHESAAMTKLAQRYHRLDLAVKRMEEKKKELNKQVKEKVEPLFDATDVVYTRIVETCSFTLQLAKAAKDTTKTEYDYEAIIDDLAELLGKDLEEKVKEIIAKHTKIIDVPAKSPALRMEPKAKEPIKEGFADSWDKLTVMAGTFLKTITRWALGYDKKLAKLQKRAGINPVHALASQLGKDAKLRAMVKDQKDAM